MYNKLFKYQTYGKAYCYVQIERYAFKGREM